MGVDLAVRVHRAGDVAAAMRAEQHAVLRAALWRRPQGRNSPGIGFDVIDAARLAGDPRPTARTCGASRRAASPGSPSAPPPIPGKACSAPRSACSPSSPPSTATVMSPKHHRTPGPFGSSRALRSAARLRRPDRGRAPAAPPCRRIRARAPASPPRRRSASAPRSPWRRSRRARTSRGSRNRRSRIRCASS